MSFQTCKSFVRLREHNLGYFRWKPGGLWLSLWLPSNCHCQGPEKYEKLHQNCPSAISCSTITLWSYKNTCQLCQGSDILESICWTQTVYAVLCQPHHTNTSSTFVFHTFLGPDSVNCLAVNGTVLKTNEAFTGLDRNAGKWIITTFHCGVEYPFVKLVS